ncbi:FliH/SctL family protein [Neptuniibacter sp. CAU 1671]|uniref:FliH/SctL family protein n=1 Tax=Neptuniibacter sp. CAU 1671 TaxID=3032593 RepID=UPI0023DAFED1|nr:FliH/SctL family protein [Neptuniibacter sp. CAU 1671]MDF2181351.1 FliH/SctL family protein [Neptuniibacter sp. CAU 1671]
MSQEDNKYKRIRAADAGAVEGWHLPDISSPVSVGLQRQDGAIAVRVTEEEFRQDRVTLTELESIRENARLEGLAAGLEEGRARGLEEGRAEGLKTGQDQGYAAGLSAGENEIKQRMAQLEGMIQQLSTPISQQQSSLETLLLNLVLQVSKTVVGHELATRPTVIANAIRDAISQIPEPLGEVELTLHPQDIEWAKHLSDTLTAGLQLVANEQLTPGGFRLKTVNSLVTHEVESRFSQVADQLLTHLNARADAVDDGSA